MPSRMRFPPTCSAVAEHDAHPRDVVVALQEDNGAVSGIPVPRRRTSSAADAPYTERRAPSGCTEFAQPRPASPELPHGHAIVTDASACPCAALARRRARNRDTPRARRRRSRRVDVHVERFAGRFLLSRTPSAPGWPRQEGSTSRSGGAMRCAFRPTYPDTTSAGPPPTQQAPIVATRPALPGANTYRRAVPRRDPIREDAAGTGELSADEQTRTAAVIVHADGERERRESTSSIRQSARRRATSSIRPMR